MIIILTDTENVTYEYTMEDNEVQFIMTADKGGINYEFNNLYAKTNPNFLYNIFMTLKDIPLKSLSVQRENFDTPLVYNFNPDNSFMIYNFSTLERNQNIPTSIRDNEVLRIFAAYNHSIDNNKEILTEE